MDAIADSTRRTHSAVWGEMQFFSWMLLVFISYPMVHQVAADEPFRGVPAAKLRHDMIPHVVLAGVWLLWIASLLLGVWLKRLSFRWLSMLIPSLIVMLYVYGSIAQYLSDLRFAE